MGRKRRFDGDSGPGMGMGRGRGMGMPMGMPMGMMGGRMGGMRGPMGAMPGPMRPGMMGPMMGRGGMAPPAQLAMMERQAMALKRQRMLEAEAMAGGPRPPGGRVSGGGGVRGAPTPGIGPPGPGFMAKGAMPPTPQYRNGGPAPPPDPEIMQKINDATSPNEVLVLWSDVSQAWEEGHLGQGLLRFAHLIAEHCPEDAGHYKRHAQFRSMMTAAKTNMQSMRPTDRAKVARSMGKLLYQDEDLCVALVRSLITDLEESPPLAVAGIVCGLGQVAYRPETRALRSIEAYIGNHAPNMTPADVKDFLVAFAAMEAPPQAVTVNAAILPLPTKFGATSPQDLALLLSALSKMQFTPPPQFTVACATFLMSMLDTFFAAPNARPPIDAPTVIGLLASLVSFTYDPPPPLLTLACKATLVLLDTAGGGDLSDLLEVLADAVWHPSPPFLARIQDRLTQCVDEMPIVAICTSFWAFAVFGYVPSIPLQKAYANRIESDLEQLNAYQICSLLWVYALFRTCTLGVWNTLVSKLAHCATDDIDDAALKYLFQVYVLLKHGGTSSMEQYAQPKALLKRAQRVWLEAKEEETHAKPTAFEKDVTRVLSLLNLNTVESKVVIEDGLFAVDLWVPAASLAIMCLPANRFTVNAVAVSKGAIEAPQPLGQTKMLQQLLRACRVPVCMIPQHIWMDLGSDEMKRDFLSRQIRKQSTMAFQDTNGGGGTM